MQTQKEREYTKSETLRLLQIPFFMSIHNTSHFLTANYTHTITMEKLRDK